MRTGCWIGLGVASMAGLASIYGAVRLFTTYYDFGAAARELPAATAEYRANGLPFVAADLFPSRVASDQNAASAIRAAMKLLRGTKVGSQFATAMKTPGPAADAVLAKYDKSLAVVQAAVTRPKVDFARDWDLGPYILFPEYAPMKAMAKAASHRAVRSAQRGDDTAALRDLTLARRLAEWAGQEPALISVLVHIANEAIALNGVERCVVAAAGRPDRIERYARWLAVKPPLPDFGNALRGEAFLGVAIMRNFDRFGGINAIVSLSEGEGSAPKIDPSRLRRSGAPTDGRQRGFLTRHFQLWNEAYRTTGRFKEPAEKIGHRLDQISTRLGREKGLSHLLEQILPVFGQAGEAVTTLEARRAVQTGFAEAMAVHAKTGRWPEKVSSKDPFTGGLLHVKRDGQGIRVYSVGKDRKDDGGLLKREASKLGRKGEDLAAAYPPIAP